MLYERIELLLLSMIVNFLFKWISMASCLIKCDFNIIFSFFFYILWIRKHDPNETCNFVSIMI